MTRKVQQLINSSELSQYLDKLKKYHLPTYEHSVRVAAYVEKVIAHLKDVDGFITDDLIKGALLHDIGKLKVPSSILVKEASLSNIEWGILKEHPNYGYKLVADEFNDCILNCIRYHHERFDGNGYPYGLSLEIPKEAAIISICDMYDAMTTDRTYRSAMSHEATMEQLYADAKNYKLDSTIIDALAGHHSIGEKYNV